MAVFVSWRGTMIRVKMNLWNSGAICALAEIQCTSAVSARWLWKNLAGVFRTSLRALRVACNFSAMSFHIDRFSTHLFDTLYVTKCAPFSARGTHFAQSYGFPGRFPICDQAPVHLQLDGGILDSNWRVVPLGRSILFPREFFDVGGMRDYKNPPRAEYTRNTLARGDEFIIVFW